MLKLNKPKDWLFSTHVTTHFFKDLHQAPCEQRTLQKL